VLAASIFHFGAALEGRKGVSGIAEKASRPQD
jgi:hypothetical protein